MTKLPNSSQCFVCGLENHNGLHLNFYQEGDTVVANHVVPEHFQGYPGVVHGGIVASMLDEVLGRVFMLDDPNRFMYTARLTMRYRKPVPTGKPLRMVGRATRDRGRTAESKAQLFGPDGELLVEADGLLVELPEEIHDSSDLEALGWKVYPDQEDRL